MRSQGAKVGSIYVEMTGHSDQFKRTMADADAQAKRTAASMRTAFAMWTADGNRLGEQMRMTLRSPPMRFHETSAPIPAEHWRKRRRARPSPAKRVDASTAI